MNTEEFQQNKRFFIFDWLISLQRATTNHEKLILYIFIGILIAIVYILSMLVIKQYIQRRNLFKKFNKLDMHEYDSSHKKIYCNTQSPVKTNLEKSNINTSDTNISVTKSPKKEKNKNIQRIGDKKSNKISKSSSNIYMPNEQSSEQEIRTPMLSNYDKLSNNSFINQHNGLNLSHANLHNNNYNNQVNEQENFDQFDGFKLITRNGSTKIVNGQNDDISEYEIPIIRYNDRPSLNQYTNNFIN